MRLDGLVRKSQYGFADTINYPKEQNMSTSMTEFASIPALHLVDVSGGSPVALPPKHRGQAHPPAPKKPTEVGNICRDMYAGVGGVLGGTITAETGGWGALPGGVLGGALGRKVCPP